VAGDSRFPSRLLLKTLETLETHPARQSIPGFEGFE
jgi:hypothetical protein